MSLETEADLRLPRANFVFTGGKGWRIRDLSPDADELNPDRIGTYEYKSALLAAVIASRKSPYEPI